MMRSNEHCPRTFLRSTSSGELSSSRSSIYKLTLQYACFYRAYDGTYLLMFSLVYISQIFTYAPTAGSTGAGGYCRNGGVFSCISSFVQMRILKKAHGTCRQRKAVMSILAHNRQCRKSSFRAQKNAPLPRWGNALCAKSAKAHI